LKGSNVPCVFLNRLPCKDSQHRLRYFSFAHLSPFSPNPSTSAQLSFIDRQGHPPVAPFLILILFPLFLRVAFDLFDRFPCGFLCGEGACLATPPVVPSPVPPLPPECVDPKSFPSSHSLHRLYYKTAFPFSHVQLCHIGAVCSFNVLYYFPG